MTRGLYSIRGPAHVPAAFDPQPSMVGAIGFEEIIVDFQQSTRDTQEL